MCYQPQFLASSLLSVPTSTQWVQEQAAKYFVNPLATDDAFWSRQFLAACYQLVQSVLKIGSALAERVGQGGVGWVHRSG